MDDITKSLSYIGPGPIGHNGSVGVPGTIGIPVDLYYFFLNTYKIIFPGELIKKTEMIEKVKSELGILNDDDFATAKSKFREYKINKILQNGRIN